MEFRAIFFIFLLMTVQISLGFARMFRTKVRLHNQNMETTSSQKEDSFKASDSSISPLPIDSKLVLENSKRMTRNGTFNFEE